MAITSLQFAGFSLGVLAVYYLLPRRPQNTWLLLASYAFCVAWAWPFALILLLVTLVNFVIAQQLEPAEYRRALLGLGIGFNVLVLASFRLAQFFVPDLEQLFNQIGISTELGVVALLVPVGLSFYVLQNISYLVDVHRLQVAPSHDLVDYALYQAYFPRLLAGPIERAGAFLPQLAQPRIVDNELLARSLALIVAGAVRKILIADSLTAAIPADLLQAPEFFWAPELFIWLVVFAFALYNDFAGYTSIVRGVSGLFGIELSPNFQFPYFARNFAEFWNRWHITLSHWLRDYIFFPSARGLLRRFPGRQRPINLIMPPMATMLISGLWHGVSPSMLLWGGLHGVYLILERLLALRRPAAPPDRQPRWRQGLAMAAVFTLVVWAWVPFWMELPQALAYWAELLTNWTNVGLRYGSLLVLVPFVGLAAGLDAILYRAQGRELFWRLPRLARAALIATALFALIVATRSTVAPFVYQGF
ncbi:MAG: MBOAT family O-acyltransferase [Candidatus Promineifilaceae bacterium]